MEDIQCSGSPRSKMASMYQLRCKNLVTLAPVLGAISHSGLLPGPYKILWLMLISECTLNSHYIFHNDNKIRLIIDSQVSNAQCKAVL